MQRPPVDTRGRSTLGWSRWGRGTNTLGTPRCDSNRGRGYSTAARSSGGSCTSLQDRGPHTKHPYMFMVCFRDTSMESFTRPFKGNHGPTTSVSHARTLPGVAGTEPAPAVKAAS